VESGVPAELRYWGYNMSWFCSKCEKSWSYPLKECIFCGNPLIENATRDCCIIGSTKVFVPSTENEKVPYYVYLTEDKNGVKSIIKSQLKFEVGDRIDLNQKTVPRTKIGIVGSGLMGLQISEYLILRGYPIVIKSRNENNYDRILSKLKQKISHDVGIDELAFRLKCIKITSQYSDLSDCSIIIDASSENLSIKKEIFIELSKISSASTILATNSSSLSIDEIASVTKYPGQVIGIHFFNPVKKMSLVEVIIGTETSDKTKEIVMDFLKNIEKVPIFVKNNPGFIVNRLLLPQINEAIKLLESGIATKEDIDTAVKLGLNHPMGPFQLADFIGLDICLSILEVLHTELQNDYYKPADLLYIMVNEGRLGYKTGKGFYEYKTQFKTKGVEKI